MNFNFMARLSSHRVVLDESASAFQFVDNCVGLDCPVGVIQLVDVVHQYAQRRLPPSAV